MEIPKSSSPRAPRHLMLYIACCLSLIALILNYRGVQYEIETDTWWGAADEMTRSVAHLLDDDLPPDPYVDYGSPVTDRRGRPYCYDEWHYYDHSGRLHFCFSRLVVLTIWYAYIFLGPWLMIWLIVRHFRHNRTKTSPAHSSNSTEWTELIHYLETNGWSGHRLFGFGYIYRRGDDTLVLGNGGIRFSHPHDSDTKK